MDQNLPNNLSKFETSLSRLDLILKMAWKSIGQACFSLLKMFSAIDNLSRKPMEADGTDQLYAQETNILNFFSLVFQFC
jgi:hypothetical protein